MAAPVARIVHGNLPATVELLDEPDMLVDTYNFSVAREEKQYKGATSRGVEGLEYTNPIGTHSFSGRVSERTGLCDQHPGTAVASLLNFAAIRCGMDPAIGMLIYKDPSFTENLNDPEAISFTVMHFPFVEAPVI